MTPKMRNATFMVALLGTTALASSALSQAAAAGADQNTSKVEEVVVTAQRREERLQDVPIAVTALSAQSIASHGATSTHDLAALVPGLDMSSNLDGATPYIRGVGTIAGSLGQEESVATYVDGVYLASPQSTMFSFNNIQRLEVLKGPQGTLFGRNATGGVINIITKDPSHTASADASIGYGNYETVEGSFYGTTGITDTLAADLSIYGRDQSNGWGRDVVTGQKTFTGSDLGLRTKWLWTPTDHTRVHLAVDYERTIGEEGEGLNFLPGSVGADHVTTNAGFYNTHDNPNDGADVRQGGASIQVDQDIAAVHLVSISSYRRLSGFFRVDQDATPLTIVDAEETQKDRTFTQELQLLPSSKSAKLQWIVGFFYFNDNPSYDPLQESGSIAKGNSALQIFSSQKTESYAGYAQATREIVARTNLTLGIRYTDDQRSIDGHENFVNAGKPDVLVLASSQSKSFSKVTYRAALDHKFTDDLMVYASYNRGFKSGLFNNVNFSQAAVFPEVLDAYEVGLKSELFDRKLRLNASAFYYKYTNIQIQEILAGSQLTLNAAAAEIKGVDADFELVPMKHLLIQGGLSVLDGHYTSFPAAPHLTPNPAGGDTQSTINAAGFDTVHTPKFTGDVAATYKIPSTVGDFDLTGSYAYNSGFAWFPDGRIRQPAFGLVSASLGWMPQNGSWGIRVWGRNINGAHYYSYATETTLGDYASPAAPRTYGVTLSKHF